MELKYRFCDAFYREGNGVTFDKVYKVVGAEYSGLSIVYKLAVYDVLVCKYKPTLVRDRFDKYLYLPESHLCELKNVDFNSFGI